MITAITVTSPANTRPVPEGYLAVLVLGYPEVEFGDEVVLRTTYETEIPSLGTWWVIGVDCAPIHEVDVEVAQLFYAADAQGLHTALCKRYGTGLPDDVTVTIYSLAQRPVEFGAVTETV